MPSSVVSPLLKLQGQTCITRDRFHFPPDSRFKNEDSRLFFYPSLASVRVSRCSRLQSPVSSLSYSSRLQAPGSRLAARFTTARGTSSPRVQAVRAPTNPNTITVTTVMSASFAHLSDYWCQRPHLHHPTPRQLHGGWFRDFCF